MNHSLTAQQTKVDTDQTRETTIRLEKAVQYINARVNESVHSLLDIGSYLLQEFFHSDLSRVRSRAPHKDVSLRKLANCTNLNLSYRSLCNALNLAVQERRFFSHNTVFSNLTESHKLLLLHIDSDGDKLQYAKDVIQHELTVRELKSRLVDAGYIVRKGPKIAPSGNATSRTDLVQLVKPFAKLNAKTLSNMDLHNLPVKERFVLRMAAQNAKQVIEDLLRTLSNNDSQPYGG